MKDKIMILDGSRRLHIDNTLEVLSNLRNIRQIQQRIWKSFDLPFIDSYVAQAYNSGRAQVDVEEFMARLSMNNHLQRENYDALKIVLIDKDMYSSREGTNFGFGVTFAYDNANKYVIVSTARLRDELHARHVLAHELGHAFGAPSSERQDVYNSLGMHCEDRNCTMHQELSGESSYQQAQRIARQGRVYCPSCTEDIRGYMR